jgi:hypothetical protein
MVGPGEVLFAFQTDGKLLPRPGVDSGSGRVVMAIGMGRVVKAVRQRDWKDAGKGADAGQDDGAGGQVNRMWHGLLLLPMVCLGCV